MTNNVNFNGNNAYYGNVNFTGGTYYSPYDIQNLAKYATGVAITHQPEMTMSSLVSSSAGNLAIQGLSWLKDNKGNYAGAIKAQGQAAQQLSQLYKSQDSFTKGVKAVSCATSSSQLLAAMPTAEKLATMSTKTQAMYQKAKIAAETLGQTGSTHAFKTANQLLCEANAAAAKEAGSAATGLWGKTKNALGFNKASAAINTAAAKSSVGSACLNEFKAQGGGMMLVMEGATEVITNVVPTFKQLGAKAGMKQVGKSAVKTVASVGGWVAGAAIGTKIGAAIGTALGPVGTACGGIIGAAVGSICSLVGGIFGSKLAKKGAEKIVGKDELVLAQEKQAAQLAQQAQVDGQTLNAVVGAASERLNAEGLSSKDAEIAYNSLNAVTSGNSIAAQTQTPSNATNPFGTPAMPSFTANSAMLDAYAAQYGLV